MQIQNGPFWSKAVVLMHRLSLGVSERKRLLKHQNRGVGMPTKRFLLFQLILFGISQILTIYSHGSCSLH